jgi:hypothetical protein
MKIGSNGKLNLRILRGRLQKRGDFPGAQALALACSNELFHPVATI